MCRCRTGERSAVGFHYYRGAVTEHLGGAGLNHGRLEAHADHRVRTQRLGIFNEAIDGLLAALKAHKKLLSGIE